MAGAALTHEEKEEEQGRRWELAWGIGGQGEDDERQG